MTATARPRLLSNDFYAPLKARAAEIERRFRELTRASAALFEKASRLYPGGFTRDAILRKPYAPFMVKGKGAVLTDQDGRAITDFWFNATSLPLGHADPRVIAAAAAQLEKGTAFFAPTENELALAAILCERLPSAERVRFTNSGSEAVMVALRLARAFTGRDVVVKCEGSYHGIYDDAQWSVSPPTERFGDPKQPAMIPDSAGLPSGHGRVAVVPYNDLEALRRTVRTQGDRIAAILLEPLSNKLGEIVADREFLAGARQLCDECGAVLIFDEVIAFRLGYHGAQGYVGVNPDLTTLGKVIGGGFPVGAVVGRGKVMAVSKPGRQPRVAHAGTFNANPMTMAAGRATMEALTPDVFAAINARGERLAGRLREMCKGLPVQITGTGSLFKITATERAIRNYRDIATADRGWEEIASMAMYNAGFLLTPNLHTCVSAATSDAHVEAFAEGFAEVIRP